MSDTLSFHSLDDWLPWLESLSPREIVLGLERVHTVLEQLSLPRPECVITIAGTNGKGSSIAFAEALLLQQGVRTGSYTSPHVHRYNERTRIDGRPVSDAAIISALQAVEAARGDIPLTFFEFGTLATLVAFADASADAWLLEVGMGGRLDAVNAIEPDGCLITNISLDHCAWLGNDIESIAAEKAGIMRAGKPVVFGAASVPEAIPHRALESGAELIVAGRDFSYEINADQSWSWQGRRLGLDDIEEPAMQGSVQYRNAAGVLALFEALSLDKMLHRPDVDSAMKNVRVAGRFEQIADRWIVDVAHNPAAAEALAGELDALEMKRPLIAVVGMLADKDVPGYIEPFGPLVDRFIAVSIEATRGADAQMTAIAIANATNKPCQIMDNVDGALAAAATMAGDDGRILVTGSFYVAGPALKWIERHATAGRAASETH